MTLRRSLKLAIASLAVWAAQPDCKAGEIDVYLFGGQSNMVGNGRVADIADDVPKVIPNAYFVYKQKIGPLTLGESSASQKKVPSFGPEIGFALEMASDTRPVYIIKYGSSGMPLHPGWSRSRWRGTDPITPGVNFYPGLDATDVNRGTLYKTMLAEFRRNLAILKEAGHTPILRGFVWMQGEQDAKHAESAGVYATSLKNLRHRLAEDLGLTDAELPLVFGQVVPKEPVPERFVAYKSIHAQMAAADQDSGKPEAIPNCKMIATGGFSLHKDMVHYDARGQLQLGRAFAKALNELAPSK